MVNALLYHSAMYGILSFQTLGIQYDVMDRLDEILSAATVRDFGIIFVLQSFSGPIYEKLHKVNARIMGPSVLIQSAHKNEVSSKLCMATF